jgi:hypothetical protein
MTVYVLKSVYFGCMEVKVLVYVIAGVIWLISKVLSANNKRKAASPMPTPTPVQVPVPPVVRKKKLEVRATKAVPKVVIDPVSLESTVGLENLTGQRKRVETTTETGLSGLFSGEMKTQADDGGQENVTIAGQISEEIRHGSFDWRRAVVINELLQRKTW